MRIKCSVILILVHAHVTVSFKHQNAAMQLLNCWKLAADTSSISGACRNSNLLIDVGDIIVRPVRPVEAISRALRTPSLYRYWDTIVPKIPYLTAWKVLKPEGEGTNLAFLDHNSKSLWQLFACWPALASRILQQYQILNSYIWQTIKWIIGLLRRSKSRRELEQEQACLQSGRED